MTISFRQFAESNQHYTIAIKRCLLLSNACLELANMLSYVERGLKSLELSWVNFNDATSVALITSELAQYTSVRCFRFSPFQEETTTYFFHGIPKE